MRDLTVMTFNIRYGSADDGADSWPERAGLLFDVIRAAAPDVVGLQEALRFQLDTLAAEFPDYGEVGVGRDDGVAAGEYAAILYRRDRFRVTAQGTFWFSDTPEVAGSVSWGNRITRICTWARLVPIGSTGGFHVYNVHLDHESQPSRARSVELLAARLAARSPAEPAIVTGDFNAAEDNPAFRYLVGRLDRASMPGPAAPRSPRLTDTFRRIYPAAANVGTYHAFRGDSTGAKIDAILVSRGVAVLTAAIVRTSRGGRYPSDHFPVTARLGLPIR